MTANPAKKLYKLSAYIIIPAGLIFLFWRARFGYYFWDEPFIISLAKRLAEGDSLIVNEWHVSQLTGVLLLPFYRAFRMFSPDNEGIILCFRYIYCALWFSTCLRIYYVLKKKYSGAIFAFVYLILFSPLDYMSLSYTSLGLMSVLLFAALVYEQLSENKRSGVVFGIEAGILSSLYVLCCPFMAGYYFLFVIFCAVYCAVLKKKADFSGKALLNGALVSIAVCAVGAALVVGFFILRGNSVGHILECFPALFEDPVHEQSGFISGLVRVLKQYYYRKRAFSALALLSIFMPLAPKLTRKIRLPYFAVMAALFAMMQLKINYMPESYNLQVADMAVLGLAAFFMLEKKPWKMFLCFGITGFIYSVAGEFASNTGITMFTMCLAVAGVSGIICVVLLGEELAEQYRGRYDLIRYAAVILTAAVILVQIGNEVRIRMNRVYYETTFPTLTEKINEGVGKGLIVSPPSAEAEPREREAFFSLLSNADEAVVRDGNFLTLYFRPALYLETDMRMASFSGWTQGYDELLLPHLEKYYTLNPDKLPDVIFFSYKTIDADKIPLKWIENHDLYTEGEFGMYIKNN